jgi:hypothetical protein
MDKFTLFELHVHDGMEFSATNTAPAIGRSADEDEAYEELEEYVDGDESGGDDGEFDDDDAERRVDGSEAADGSGSVSPVGLLVGVLFLALVAIAVKKLRGSDAELEVAELDDLTDAVGEEGEAEH